MFQVKMISGEEPVNVMRSLFDSNLEEILMEIFLFLDPGSLKSCRVVCQEWDCFIQERLWGSRRGRRRLEHKLRWGWRASQPKCLEIKLGEPTRAKWRCLGTKMSSERVTCTACDESHLYCADGMSVRIYKLSTLKMEKTLNLRCSAWNMAVGESFLVVNQGEQILIFAKKKWTVLHQVNIPNNISSPCTSVVISGDSIIFYCRDKSFSIISREEKIWSTKLLLQPSTFSADFVETDGDFLVVGDGTMVKAFSLKNPEHFVTAPESFCASVNVVLFFPFVIGFDLRNADGFVPLESGSVRAWNMDSGLVQRSHKIPWPAFVKPLDIVSNGKQITVLGHPHPYTTQMKSRVFVFLFDPAEFCDQKSLPGSFRVWDLWKRDLSVEMKMRDFDDEEWDFVNDAVILQNKTSIIVRTVGECDTVNISKFWG